MAKLYCKKCGHYVCENNKYVNKCENCGMEFFPDRISKVVTAGLIAGMGQVMNGDILKGSAFTSFTICALIFGTLEFGIWVGLILSGLIWLSAIGEAYQKAEKMAGYIHTQVAM